MKQREPEDVVAPLVPTVAEVESGLQGGRARSGRSREDTVDLDEARRLELRAEVEVPDGVGDFRRE